MGATEPPPPVRNAGEDAVRVICLVAIVVGHVWSLEPVGRWTTSWAVPLLFLVGGYYWFAGPTVRDDLHRWTLSIGRPYLFWWVVTCVVFVGWEVAQGAGHIADTAALAAWGGAGSLRPWTGFWIVSACFLAMMMVQISMRAGWWWTLGFAYAGLVIARVEPELAMNAPLAFVSALACTGFVLLGIGLREARSRVRRPIVIGLGALGVGVAGLFVHGIRPLDLQAADFGTPGLSILVASLVGSGLILVGSAVGPRIQPAVGRVISTVARCNVAVLLSFGMVLFLLRTPENGRWQDFVLALVIPLVIAVFTLRSKWAPWVHGVQDFSYRGSSHKRFRGAMF